MDRNITDPVKRRNAITNMMAAFGMQMVDLHNSETDNNAFRNDTVCLTKNDLIHSIENRLKDEAKNYGPVPQPANDYYYPQQQQTLMMAQQHMSYPYPQPQPQVSDDFDISTYMGMPKQSPVQQDSSLDEALKPVIVRLEGICKILGFIYQELKNNSQGGSYQTPEPTQETVSKKQSKRASKKKEKAKEPEQAPLKDTYQSLDDVTEEDVAHFDENAGEAEYV